MNIRSFLMSYLKERDMTLVQLTEKLGYRSKTSLVRIMNGDVSVRSLEKFADKLRKVGGLSEDEEVQLNEAVELLRWQDDYYPSREMLSFLQGKAEEEGSVALDYLNPVEGEDGTPVTFDDVLCGASEIDVLVMNSQYVPIFSRLNELLTHKNAKISHYLMVNEDTSRTIHAMNAVFPIMFLPGYNGYLLNQTGAEGHNGIQAADFMLINWTDKMGVQFESLILFDQPNHGRVYRSHHPGTLARLVEIPKEAYRPIKRSFSDTIGGTGYVDFCLECADIERNRRVFGIKPDISMECIPVEILLSAAREGALGQTAEFAQEQSALVEIFNRRFKNAVERRKTYHMIMKRSAVWKFVKTGRLTDHFWGMRPFTLQERAAIMRHLLDQAENNPFFHIHFLKDNQFLRDMEVFCYDGKGLLIVNVNTDYDLAQGHAEIMLDHPEFQRLYKDFYLKHLIRDSMIPSGEVIDFLRSLVRYCEDPSSEDIAE